MTKTLNQLTEITELDDDDLLLARDVSAVEDKRITVADLQAGSAKLSGGADANFAAMPQVGGDPIVESGSNSDGDWTRLADGTLLIGFIDSQDSSLYGSLSADEDYSITVQLPVQTVEDAYIVVPSIDYGSAGGGGVSRPSVLNGPFAAEKTSTSFIYRLIHDDDLGESSRVCYFAYAKWK